MDFFKRQDIARRNTKILVLYFVIAVALIVLSIDLIAAMAFSYIQTAEGYQVSLDPLNTQFWMSDYVIYVSIASCCVILFGNLKAFLSLRNGGMSVAENVGASEVSFDTKDSLTKRYINIVEEMAIASGVVMPKLYVLEHDQSINAFVAGLTADNTVMVVTKGALEKLSRDELQGVVGHEFSHILHGDMRINVRLIGIIYGITMIGAIGGSILRSLFHSSRYSHRRSSGDKKGSGVLVIAGIGLGLLIVGYIGLFFGRLIKASISRQREYLADASAVQFTRNNDGIAGALAAIMYDGIGSHLDNEKSEDISHMCFGESMAFNKMFATHPPLEDRIKTISPSFLPALKLKRHSEENSSQEELVNQINSDDNVVSSFSSSQSNVVMTNNEVMDTVGSPQPQHLNLAQGLLSSIPEKLHLAVYNENSARALIYAMILSAMKEKDKVSFVAIENQDSKEVRKHSEEYYKELCNLDLSIRLPLIELCLPVLRELSEESKNEFINLCIELSGLDNKTSLFEFVMILIIRSELNGLDNIRKLSDYKSIKKVIPSLERALSLLIYVGANKQPADLYKKFMSRFKHTGLNITPLEDCKVSVLSKDLVQLSRLTPKIKRNVLNVFIKCVMHDDVIKPAEAEMLRAISMVLDCPMPPLLSMDESQ